jgi:hypothetical protein
MTDLGDRDPLDQALGRLIAAAEQVEAAVRLSAERAQSAHLRVRELEIFVEDRTRLAEDLDAANARAASLAGVNRDVSRRIEQTMDSIRGVLGGEG